MRCLICYRDFGDIITHYHVSHTVEQRNAINEVDLILQGIRRCDECSKLYIKEHTCHFEDVQCNICNLIIKRSHLNRHYESHNQHYVEKRRETHCLICDKPEPGIVHHYDVHIKNGDSEYVRSLDESMLRNQGLKLCKNCPKVYKAGHTCLRRQKCPICQKIALNLEKHLREIHGSHQTTPEQKQILPEPIPSRMSLSTVAPLLRNPIYDMNLDDNCPWQLPPIRRFEPELNSSPEPNVFISEPESNVFSSEPELNSSPEPNVFSSEPVIEIDRFIGNDEEDALFVLSNLDELDARNRMEDKFL